MTRIDAHQHFWKLSRGDYDWLTPQDLPKLYRDFLPEHLAPLLERSGIDRTVVVQASPTDAETQFLLGLAATTPFIAGVVGWTDLESRAAVATITELSRDKRLLGLRPMVQDLADDEWLLRKSIAPAIDAMQRGNLRFDALVKPRHLPMLLRFLERHPDLRVVIDHGAKPLIASGRLEPWAAQMRRIARQTNVFCKLSGLATESGRQWTDATLEPYIDVLLDAFGPRRLMWGSDWPVLHEAYGHAPSGADTPYDLWRDTAATLTAQLSSDDRDWVFGKTAAAFYGIA
jgi:L-fuconolactonase